MTKDDFAHAPPMQLPHGTRKRRRSFENQSEGRVGGGTFERMLITYIRATNVVSRLRRIPISFYVLVESETASQRTSNKLASVSRDVIEWEEEIVLPFDVLSRISFTVFASFELGPTLGSGEMLFQVKVSLGELLERNGQLESIRSWESDDGKARSLLSSLDINIERQARIECEFLRASFPVESEETRQLGEFTDAGQRALARYREREEEQDLDESIQHFQDAAKSCPLNNPNRDIVMFNLATAKLMQCRAKEDPHELDVAINLCRDVLDLRPRGHPHHPFALLDLGIALLARFQRGGAESDEEEGRDLLSKVLDAVPTDSYGYHAAWLAFRSAAKPELLQSIRDSGGMEDDLDEDDEDEDEKVERLDAILQWIFSPDSSSHNLLDHLGILFCVQLDHLVEFAGLEEQICILEVVVQFTSDSHPYKPSWLHYLSVSFRTRYEQLEDPDDLNKSILMKQDAVRLLPDGDEDKPSWLSTLCKLFSARYELTENRSDLDQAVLMAEEAVTLTPDDQPMDKAGWLSNLGNSLLTRYEHFGNVADLNKSISSYEEAVGLTPDDNQYKPRWLDALGDSLYTRHAGFGDLGDLEGAILRHEDVLRLAADSHPDKFRSLNNLAKWTFVRYKRLGKIDDLRKSISLNEEALELVNDHADKPMLLNELGRSLLARYERFAGLLNKENLSDLERAISVGEEAVRLTLDDDSNKCIRLNNLGDSLLTQYKRFGEIDDLKRSIALHEEAVQLTLDSNPNMPIQLNNLGLSLWARFQRFGDVADLRKVISLHEDAVRLAPNSHPDKALLLDGLGNSLLTRYERFGDVADLQKSILVLEDAVRLAHDDDPHKPAWLNNLGNALSVRYESFGDLDDLERVISVHGDAVRFTPDEHADKPVLVNNLANVFAIRYEHFGEQADLEKSISMHKEALRLVPEGHPYKPGLLNDLGVSLFKLFERTAEVADLGESILMHEEAVHLTTDDHPDKPGSLNNLGSSLFMRFQRLGGIDDLERSISVTEAGMGLVANADGHPDKPLCLYTLARSLFIRFQRSGIDPSSSDLQKAITYSSQAAYFPTSPSVDRFRASRLWIECVHSLEDKGSLLDAYTVAVHLLPQLAWIGLPLHDRYHQLLRAADIACDAAATALKANMPERAIKWLEQGRSVVWSQLSQLRSPVDKLHVAHPELSAQFERISHQLERATGSRDRATTRQVTSGANAISESLEKRVEQRHALAITRESLIAQIRALPDFERFLLPKTVDQLAPFAHSGPVVFLNASKYGCDALVVLAGSERRVVHVPLSKASHSAVNNMQVRLRKMLRINGRVISQDGPDLQAAREGMAISTDNINKPSAGLENMTPNQLFEYVLPYLWDKVVCPVLDALRFSVQVPGSKLPRIFWCPAGPFTFLPIHAAGHYGPANQGPRLSEFAVSSYIPSISALELPPPAGDSRSTTTPPTASTRIRLLGVRQPSTDGANHLYGVEEEMDVIKDLSSRSPFVAFEEADGTVKDVLDKLQRSDWVHFACHGVQDRADPLESGLLLAHKRRLRVSDIVGVGVGRSSLSRELDRDQARSSGGSFAFLSACQTATGDEQLTEESVHVAAGMLLAGYGSIVATMWSIMDRDAPRVAKDVYERLFFNSDCGEGRPGELDEPGKPRVHPPDGRDAAAALHHAVEQLRESGVPFLSWVPFIHVGL